MTATPVATSLTTIGWILIAMAAIALIEAVLPLQARGRWNKAHLGPNLGLTFITFALNGVFNVALIAALVRSQLGSFGMLNAWSLPPVWSTVIVVLALDLAFYVTHVAMHKLPSVWRFHAVHHSDPAVDVTTTVRQHPVEGVLRYAVMAAVAIPLGASPEAFAVYRVLSALSGLLEHANVKLPPWLDAPLSLVFTWPSMHKVHHSRDPRHTDTNYGNVVSLWDRLFLTFTPARYGRAVHYGLDGFDAPDKQTTAGLLALPFRAETPTKVAGAYREPQTALAAHDTM